MPVQRTCKKCGKQFSTPPSHVAVYCSIKCKHNDVRAWVNRPEKKGVVINCLKCDKERYVTQSQYALGAKFCSRECHHLYNKGKPRGRRADRDEWKAFLNTAKKSAKRRGLAFKIDVNDVKRVFKRQDGLCAYTNFPLEIPYSAKVIHDFFQASIDRIDSSKGYT